VAEVVWASLVMGADALVDGAGHLAAWCGQGMFMYEAAMAVDMVSKRCATVSTISV